MAPLGPPRTCERAAVPKQEERRHLPWWPPGHHGHRASGMTQDSRIRIWIFADFAGAEADLLLGVKKIPSSRRHICVYIYKYIYMPICLPSHFEV